MSGNEAKHPMEGYDMNTKELRELVEAEVRSLIAGSNTVSKASAIFRGVDTMVKTKELELRAAKFKIETGKSAEAIDL